jgi:hypothetical protein
VQLVVGGTVAHEGVVVTAELADHVAEREDGAKDEFGVIGGRGRGMGGGLAVDDREP